MGLRLSGELTSLFLALRNPDVERSIVTFRVGDWHLHEFGPAMAISHASGLRAASDLEWAQAMLLLHDLQALPTCPTSIVELRRQREAKDLTPEVAAWIEVIKAAVRRLTGDVKEG